MRGSTNGKILIIVMALLLAGAAVTAPLPQTAELPSGAAARSNGVQASGIPSGERQALLDLYNSTNGAGWTTKTNWNGAAGTECTWYGVTCDSGSTTVQTLDLHFNNLVGTMPSSLGNLTNLQQLELPSNQLTGSIPSQLGSLTNLVSLGLSNDRLTGSIPGQLGSLTNLQYLYVNSNMLSGGIPTTLGSLTNLQNLYVNSNMLSGAIPTSLENLTKLVADHNDLSRNALYSTDATLTTFLNGKQYTGNWQSTQTVAPTGVAAGATTNTSVVLSWTPIAYTGDTGGYRAYYSMTSGGPYTTGPITANKNASSIVVSGLNPGTLYFFVVRTVTNPTYYNLNTVTSDPSAEVHTTTTNTPSYTSFVWVPVASHVDGANNSHWRSDLGLLNTGTVTANVQINFFGSSGVVSSTSYVPPQVQSIITDVVGQLPASGSGALEILSDQPLKVTERTYSQVPSNANCYANGTQGQDYPALTASDGLVAGQSAYLGGLKENVPYRSNIGVVNTGTGSATVLVELYGGTGNELTSYTVSLNPGDWKQETEPFWNKAGKKTIDKGYAKITVQTGSGVFGFASVIDNITNDPTTVTMQHAGAAQFAQQGTKLVGTGTVGSPTYQGSSVAISADGNTAIVGGDGDNNGAGAAWVFTRSGGEWAQQGSKLLGTDAVGFAQQGWSVAISGDGNTAIVGGPYDNSYAGAAWVFTRSHGVWSQQGNKLVGTGAAGGAEQGISVALSADSNTAIVGGSHDNSGVGAAWVFTRSGGVWTQVGSKLVTTSAVGTALQGQSVALSADGTTAIVGGWGDSSSTGAAWVYKSSGGVWPAAGTKLVGTDEVGAARQGTSVAISADGNTAIVGGYSDNSYVGAAWVFTRTRLGVWFQQGSKLVGTGTTAAASQGNSVAVSADGNTALVGGPADYPAGAGWVFTRSVGVWAQQGSKLIGTGAAGHAQEGSSVAISGDGTTAIVAGYADNSNAGAAWVFSAPTLVVWVPVASHVDGANNSHWRSDLGLLNTGTVTANVQIDFFGSSGVVSSTTTVPAGTQSILTDVVGQLPASGSGALEILSDQPLKVTARTYSQVPSNANCDANGTQGQDYPAVATSDGLVAGQSAYLGGLKEDVPYRSNIGVVNTGTVSATVLVELYGGTGNELTSYTVSLNPGDWKQETEPFWNKAGKKAIDRGYAKITVQTGSGLFGFASVIDNTTNDPTTVSAQR